MHLSLTTDQQHACRQVLSYTGLGELEACAFPSQGATSIVFFQSHPEQGDIAVKIPESPILGKREALWLNYLKKHPLESADVPGLISWSRAPSCILMTKLTGQTLVDKWPSTAFVPVEEVKHVGAAVGDFIAELHARTGRIYSDLTSGNLMLQPNGRIGVIDWANCSRRAAPEVAFAMLLRFEPNLIPYAAIAFESRLGRTMDPDVVGAIPQESLPWAGHPRVVAANLVEWKAMLPELRAANGRTRLQAGLARPNEITQPALST